MNFFRAPNASPYPLDEPHSFMARDDAPNLCRFCGNRRTNAYHLQEPVGRETGQLLPDPRPSTSDLVTFQSDLAVLIDMHRVQEHVGVSTSDLARKIMEYVEIVKVCHDDARELEINFVTRPHSVSLETVETVLIEPRPIHLPDGVSPEPAKIEALPTPEDWCACGWSDEPHERSEHEPAGALPDDAPTPPHAACSAFVSEPGAFAASPGSICATCGASGLAHGIAMIGPPTQIAEALGETNS